MEKKSNRVVLLVIDSLGIGAMNDCVEFNEKDLAANTALNVLQANQTIKYPTLEKLGLHHLLGIKCSNEPFIIGRSKLFHYGADSFFGHQEIMGSKCLKPKLFKFNYYLPKIMNILKQHNITYELIGQNPYLLLINNAFTLGDNIETDPGQAFNITADLNVIEFATVLNIAKIIRKVIEVPRLIVFGSKETSVSKILRAIEIINDQYIGVNAPKSGVYSKSYQCIHLGYGIDETKQCAYKLTKQNIEVTLIGKAADVITALNAKYLPCVDTQKVMQTTIEQIKRQKKGLIFANVQETDLAGHEQDKIKYGQKLKIVDNYLQQILKLLNQQDLLIIMADHGNDPTIGHSHHTREYVPILIHQINNKKQIVFEDLLTMADVGQTIYYELTNKQLEFGKIIKIP